MPSIAGPWGPLVRRCMPITRTAAWPRHPWGHKINHLCVDTCTTQPVRNVSWRDALAGGQGGGATSATRTEGAKQSDTLARADPLGAAHKPPPKLRSAFCIKPTFPRALNPRLCAFTRTEPSSENDT